MKKIFIILLAAILSVNCGELLVGYETADDYISAVSNDSCKIFYTTTDGKEITKSSNWDEPWWIYNVYQNDVGVIVKDGKPITSIDDYAFQGCTSLSSIKIPNSVTSIGEDAFYGCSNLVEVYYRGDLSDWCKISFLSQYANPLYHSSYSKKGSKLFLNDIEITNITIPADIKKLNDYAFIGCVSLSNVTLSSGVTTIGKSVFEDCISLRSATISENVNLIGAKAFQDCTSLKEVYCKPNIPPVFANGDRNVFSNNVLNRRIYVPAASVEAYKRAEGWSDYADYIVGYNFEIGSMVCLSNEIWYTNGSTTTPTTPSENNFGSATIKSNEYDEVKECWVITFDNKVEEIGKYAFSSWGSALTSITIPDSVNIIGVDAFKYCDKLKSVTIGKGLHVIRDQAFYGCLTLEAVYITDLSAWCKVDFEDPFSNPLLDCQGRMRGAKLYINNIEATKITIPSDIRNINDYTFEGCVSLTSVVIPDGVVSIGDFAFDQCISLASVIIGNSVTSIGKYAFGNCHSLTSVKIPGCVSEIGEGAFLDCELLTSVALENGIKLIGEGAFKSCYTLTSVMISESIKSIGTEAFCFCKSLNAVYCKAIFPPTLGPNAFMYEYNPSNPDEKPMLIGCKIYVPRASVEAYKAAPGWSDYADYIEGYDF